MAFKHPHPLAGTTWNVTRVKITTTIGVYLPLAFIILPMYYQNLLVQFIMGMALLPLLSMSLILPYPFARILAPEFGDAVEEDYKAIRQEAMSHSFNHISGLASIIALAAFIANSVGTLPQVSMYITAFVIFMIIQIWDEALPFYYLAFNCTPPEPAPEA